MRRVRITYFKCIRTKVWICLANRRWIPAETGASTSMEPFGMKTAWFSPHTFLDNFALGIIAGILVARHLKNTDGLY
jgi:hypothetical protein